MITIRVHVVGVLIALAFSVLGALFVIMAGYGEFIFLILILWILIPVVIAKIYYRIKK